MKKKTMQYSPDNANTSTNSDFKIQSISQFKCNRFKKKMFHRNNAKNSRIRLERRKNLLKVLRLSTTVRLLRQKTNNKENC